MGVVAARSRAGRGRSGRAGLVAFLVVGVTTSAVAPGVLAATTFGVVAIAAPTEVGAAMWIQLELTTYWESDHTQAPNVTVSARILEEPGSPSVQATSDAQGHVSLSIASPQTGGRTYNVSVVALDASGQAASEPLVIPVYVRPAPGTSAGNTPQTTSRFSQGLQMAMVIGGIAGGSTALMGVLFARRRKKGAPSHGRQP